MSSVRGRVLVEGQGRGPLLTLRQPISLWGGVDPATGRVCDPRHPDYDATLAGCVVAIPRTIGSSSSSAIMLELLRNGRHPAALLLGTIDAIVTLGVLVARELGYPTIPVVHVPPVDLERLRGSATCVVTRDGVIAF